MPLPHVPLTLSHHLLPGAPKPSAFPNHGWGWDGMGQHPMLQAPTIAVRLATGPKTIGLISMD